MVIFEVGLSVFFVSSKGGFLVEVGFIYHRTCEVGEMDKVGQAILRTYPPDV